MDPIMMRLNGGLSLKKLEWLRKFKSKQLDIANFRQRSFRLEFKTRITGRKKIQRLPR